MIIENISNYDNREYIFLSLLLLLLSNITNIIIKFNIL